ncbi:hypothetical protein [Ancylobacter pratisalsi]|uniref:Uncharacterized protein n=1 Tax=Ancylobacter pratisalsi TaxID=1745854 RepID=A0A6P1YP63_9HYPH|nr:hypothetical protein [Ancylobacter pratisalsi]QIB33534.1 hypothetical protein G3A50_07310 [Ancylobacter pratisalsi]
MPAYRPHIPIRDIPGARRHMTTQWRVVREAMPSAAPTLSGFSCDLVAVARRWLS